MADTAATTHDEDRRRRTAWQKVPFWAQVAGIVLTVVASVFAGGRITERTLTEYTVRMPEQLAQHGTAIAANAAAIDTLDVNVQDFTATMNRRADSASVRAEALFFYLVCRQEEGDGQCAYILPSDVNRRLNEILGKAP